MYVPPRFREERLPVLHDAIAGLRFGTLVTVGAQGPLATHLPMLLDAAASAKGTITGHIARANPQWERSTQAPAIATFVGPNFYVTPGWYATKAQTGKVVPTWNYIAVEARGRLRFFEDRVRLLALVDRLTAVHEATQAQPWAVGDAPAPYVDQLLGAIVGFELEIEELTGAWKLGQNKSDADRAGVAAGVSAALDDPAVLALLPMIAPEPADA